MYYGVVKIAIPTILFYNFYHLINEVINLIPLTKLQNWDERRQLTFYIAQEKVKEIIYFL